MQIGTEANSRSGAGTARDIATIREIWSILSEGGVSPAHGVEWLLDNVERRAEERT